MKSLICFFTLIIVSSLPAAEESGSWPLGPIGGEFRISTGQNFVRVSGLQSGGPGEVAGLQINDFVFGAFGQDFDPIGGNFEGVVRQLGNAIEHAESTDGVLPLKVLRPGTGVITVTVNLPVLGALNPAYPLTSTKYSNTYEYACAELHSRVMSDSDGNLGYPTGFIGLALLGHPNWNDTTGAKPYRLSINKIRDYFIGRINGAVYAPVEDLLLDDPANPSANPNYVNNPVGLEAWSLGQAVMFMAEYRSKTGDASVDAVLQRGAELMANRVQYWKQPVKHSNGYSVEYNHVRGMTSHGGVTGDYTHSGWFSGINMAGLHLFGGLALAKRAGVDMTIRPRDGHLFGFNLNAGDPIPASINSALPNPMVLPRGCEDARTLPSIDNVTNAPLTTITDPFYYDLSLDQKFWMKWDYLRRSTGNDGHVGYAAGVGAQYDAGGRTPGSLFGLMAYHGTSPLAAEDQNLANQMKSYIIAAHERHLNAHAYNMGGGLFTALILPWLDDRDQRYFLDNWKFYVNLMRQPDGSLQYFRGRSYGDAYQDNSLVVLVNNALPRSVATGGLPHVPSYATNRVFASFRKPLLEWPEPSARFRRTASSSEVFQVDLLDSSGAVISPAQVTASWSVLSGPVTSGVLSSTNTLNTTASFPQPGLYRLQLDATDNTSSLSTSEVIDVQVLPAVGTGYVAGQAEYKVYTGINGASVASLTSAGKYPNSPDQTSMLTKLSGTYSGNNYGSTITTTVVAPETGTYRFYIASDDASSLLFNAGGSDAAGAVEIASVPGWTDKEVWNKYASQQSVAIQLTAGEHYYLQALHKEGGGSDHLEIAWTTPSDTTIRVIDAPYLALPVLAPAILTQPESVTANLGDNVSFSIATQGRGPGTYQWRHNGVNFGSPRTDPTLALNNVGARLAGTWDCVFTSGETVLVSDAVALTINGLGALTMGGLWQEMFTGVNGGTVEALLAHPNYPLLSSSSSVITETSNASLGDNYGQRWSGWLIPSVSGRYRFYAAADDRTRLYLSTDEHESNKSLIHSIHSYTGEKVWSSNAPSAWVGLEAGKRYFVEFFHAEGGGGDHAAFVWQREGDPAPTNGSGVIPAANLQYVTGGTLPDPTTFNEWRAYHFTPNDLLSTNLTGPDTDKDGDGISNLMEYALGLNPHQPDSHVSGLTYDIETIESKKYLRLTVHRNHLATDLVYNVEVCGDAELWGTASTVVEENSATVLRVRDSVSFDDVSPRFIRLKVTQM